MLANRVGSKCEEMSSETSELFDANRVCGALLSSEKATELTQSECSFWERCKLTDTDII